MAKTARTTRFVPNTAATPLMSLSIDGSINGEGQCSLKQNHIELLGRGTEDYIITLRQSILEGYTVSWRIPEMWDREWNHKRGPIWTPLSVIGGTCKCWLKPEKYETDPTTGDNVVEIDDDSGTGIVFSQDTSSRWVPLYTPTYTAAIGTVSMVLSPPTEGETISIESTDGTRKTYTAAAAEDPSVREFNVSGTSVAAATSLKDCLEAVAGHSGKITVVDNGSGGLTLTQVITGSQGNTRIVSDLTNTNVVNFKGGSNYNDFKGLQGGGTDDNLYTNTDEFNVAQGGDFVYYFFLYIPADDDSNQTIIVVGDQSLDGHLRINYRDTSGNTDITIRTKKVGTSASTYLWNDVLSEETHYIIGVGAIGSKIFLRVNGTVYDDGDASQSGGTPTTAGELEEIDNENLGTDYDTMLLAAYATGSSVSQEFAGVIWEMVYVKENTSETLSASEFEKIEGYLAHKYNFNTKLVADHPYEVYPPRATIIIPD